MPDTDIAPPHGIERPHIPLEMIGHDSSVAIRKSDGAQVDWVKFDRPVTDEEVAILNTSLAFVWDRVPDQTDELYVTPKEIL